MKASVFLGALLICATGAAKAQDICASGLSYEKYDLPGAWFDLQDPERIVTIDIMCNCQDWRAEGRDCESGGFVALWNDDEGAPFEVPFRKNGFESGPVEVTLPSGRLLTMRHQTREFGRHRQGAIDITLQDAGTIVFEDTALSSSIYDSITPDCAFGPGEVGMWPGTLQVLYPPSAAEALAFLAARRGWTSFDDEYQPAGPEVLVGCAQRWGHPGSRSDHCVNALTVGPGTELDAISQINALDPGICAMWEAAGAGGAPPIQIVALPFGSLLNASGSNPAALAARLDGVFNQNIWDDRVQRSGFRALGTGNLFAARVLAPGHLLEITQSDGFWYQIDFSLSVGLQMGHGVGLQEEMTLTVLDVIEIRAPDGVARLPQGIISGGTPLRLLADSMDEAANGGEGQDAFEIGSAGMGPLLTQDGMRMADWQRLIATKLAATLGGNITGGL